MKSYEHSEVEQNGSKRIRGKRDRGASGNQPVFGMLKRDGKVIPRLVKNCSASELIPILSQYSELDSSTIYILWLPESL